MSAYNFVHHAKEEFSKVVAAAYKLAVEAGELQSVELSPPSSEIPKDSKNGDISSNFALVASKLLRKNPKALADTLIKFVKPHKLFEDVQAAGPGFINAFYSPLWYKSVLSSASEMGQKYGYDNIGEGKRVIIEYVSANPTGPMHVGNARGGVLGDSLASILERVGYKVWREFYVNDAGNQVELLGLSVEARYLELIFGEDNIDFPENGYKGEDIKQIAGELLNQYGDSLISKEPAERRSFMRDFALKKNIDSMQRDMARYKVIYDNWFFESSLHQSGYVEDTIKLLDSLGVLYNNDNALWFKGKYYGMEKDEVITKSNGYPTYYAVDIAYHRNKFERGFDTAIDILGADHHGHALRFKAGVAALGIEAERLSFVLYQLVRLISGGEVVRMSKRTGKAISLSGLLDEISVDAARFFFNSRSSDTHLDFDLDLAIRRDSDNPVYYVQYAHARICSLLKNLEHDGLTAYDIHHLDIDRLSEPSERILIKTIAQLPEEIKLAARDLEPFRLTRYLIDLATAFHVFYTEVRIKDSEIDFARSRLLLCEITRSVLSNVLTMLKISAPEQM